MKRFDLIGNRHIKEAAQRGDLGSAVIFDGGSGFGKKAAAAYAAAALLCRTKDDAQKPCGRCISCNQAYIGTHPDIIFFNRQGENIKVKDVRALRLQTFVSANQSLFKVFIINRADLMNQESQNALLKVLEESRSSIFILLAENASALLQTVRSRCRIYAMEAVDSATVAEYLREYLRARGKAASEAQINQAAESCGGSIGRAIALMENGGGKPAAAARVFLKALEQGQLEIMEACLKASALNRADYGGFYTEVTEGLVQMAVKTPASAPFYAAVYDYIQGQRDKLTDNNASVFALSSQLAVFCGQYTGDNK